MGNGCEQIPKPSEKSCSDDFCAYGWEAAVLEPDGQILVTRCFMIGERIFRACVTLSIEVDKEKYDETLRRHGPLESSIAHFLDDY